MWKKRLKKLRSPESFVSITLGFLVVIVAGLLLYNYISGNKPVTTEETKESTATAEVNGIKTENIDLPAKYKVVSGDTLWTIAEKYYGSGYNWVTIANDNKLPNASIIEVGQELNIPKTEVIKPVNGQVSVKAVETSKNYTVQKGDYLWNIAVRNYGDGFAWVKIAKANNLANPNLIHPGNVLVIPQ